jgi:gluconate 2-dehydrogenase alpha chain
MVTKLDKVDVVTVGVGWSGGIIAAELSKAGYQIVGLDRGAPRTLEDYLGSKDELRYRLRGEMMTDLSDSTYTVRNNLNQDAVPLRNKSLVNIGKDIGGGGSHWNGATPRYYPYDFEIKSQTIERYGENKIPKDMTIQDWGITYDELEPYYDTFEKTMGISAEEDPNPNAPYRSNPFPTPPLKQTPTMLMFRKAAEKLGYDPRVRESANISETYENPDGETINACQYCSFCDFFGCDFGAKSDPIITVIPTAQKTGNFELRAHSEVKRVLYDSDRATGVLYVNTQTGEEFEQPADVVVLTSYTFNNVRLLLLSEIGKPYDPKTGKGIIGKNFTDHHFFPSATGFFNDRKFNKYIGTGALGMNFTNLAADNFDHSDLDFLHGAQVQMGETGNLPIDNNPVLPNTPSWGKEFKKQSLYYYNRTIGVTAQVATLPKKENYLDLDPTYTDEYGDPLIRITWDFSDQDRKRNQYFSNICSEILKEMGADEVVAEEMPEHYEGFLAFQHNAGGAIMGDNPETSAVNNYMQMWEMDNLFVCGASSFPHFGAGNPTLTMGALTYRAAEGIIEYLENGGGQLVKAKDSTQKA